MHENPLNPVLTGAHLKEDKSFSFAEMTLQYFLHNVHFCWWMWKVIDKAFIRDVAAALISL